MEHTGDDISTLRQQRVQAEEIKKKKKEFMINKKAWLDGHDADWVSTMEKPIFIMNGKYYCVMLSHYRDGAWQYRERSVLCFYNDQTMTEYTVSREELDGFKPSSWHEELKLYIIPSNIVPKDIFKVLMDTKKTSDRRRHAS